MADEQPWTLPAFMEYCRALREADQRAVTIQREADLRALDLARADAVAREEKANRLREQIASERGLYATKEDLKPVLEFIAGQQGTQLGRSSAQQLFLAVPGLILAVLMIGGVIVGIAYAVRN
jgi:hypothetical protein